MTEGVPLSLTFHWEEIHHKFWCKLKHKYMTKTQIHKQSTHKYVTNLLGIRKDQNISFLLDRKRTYCMLQLASLNVQRLPAVLHLWLARLPAIFTLVIGKIACNFTLVIGKIACNFTLVIGKIACNFTLVIGKIACYFTLVIGKIACNFTLAVGQCPGIAQCSENFGVYCMQLPSVQRLPVMLRW